jgi:hypothetical protein
MFPFVALAISVAFTYLNSLLMRKKSKASTIDEIQVPTATEDRPKPYWVGTVRHKSPNCVWYGDYSTKAIKAGGLMTMGIKTVTGYKYFLGFDLNLGWGQMDELLKIRIADKDAWSGSISSGTIVIDKPKLFGGENESSNDGGFQAKVTVYNGNGTQGVDPYLAAKSGPTPAYKKDVHLVFQGITSGGAYIGNSTSLPEMSFDGRRCPNTLGVIGSKHVIDTYDANPVCALYEFMTRPQSEFGGGYATSQFDTASWLAAASTVYTEGLGISRMFDSASDVESVIKDYLELIDGVLNIDMVTGKISIALARDDYDPATLPVLNDANVLEIVSFKQGSFQETHNEVRLSYIDRTAEFESRPAAQQDAANVTQSGEVRSQDISIKGISNPTTANKVIFRELRVVSTPLATLTIRVNREAFAMKGAGVFKHSSARHNISEKIYRITEIDKGKVDAGVIEIKAVQDIFSFGSVAYDAPQSSGWSEPSTVAAASTDQLVIEQPRFLHGTDETRILSIAKPVNGAQQAYNLWAKESTGAAYDEKLRDVPFTPVGTLVGAYQSTQYNTSSQLVVTPVFDMEDLPSAINASEIRAGGGLILIDNEVLAYESYTINGSGQYVFNGVWGGLLDTVLASHATGAKAWFISAGSGVATGSYTALSTVNAKLLPLGSDGVLDISAATAINLATVNRAARPIRPGNVTVGGTAYGASIPAAGLPINLTWALRKRSATSIYKDTDASDSDTGLSVTVKVYDGTGALLNTYSGLSGTAWTYDAAMQTADNAHTKNQLVFVVYSMQSGASSYQANIISTARPTFSPSTTLPTFSPSGTYSAPASDGTINGVQVSGTPDSTHTVPVYDPGTGQIVWLAAPFAASAVDVTVTTASLAHLTTDTLSAAFGKSYIITKITADKECWVRVYTDPAYRTADASRLITADPTGEHGVVADLNPIATNLTLDLAPQLCGSTLSRSSSAPVAITNRSGSTGTVTVTFSIIKLEA